MFKTLIHRLIGWYLRRCGGAFHRNAYGPDGRYVVEMTELQYAHHCALVQDEATAKIFMQVLLDYRRQEAEAEAADLEAGRYPTC